MSRVDYLTIGIVSVCLLALGFLVYKTVRLMGGGDQSTEQGVVDPSYSADTTLSPDTYSYEYGDTTAGAKTSPDEDLDDDQVGYSDNSEIASPKSGSKSDPTYGSKSITKPSSSKQPTSKEKDVASSPAEDDAEIKKPVKPKTSTSSNGNTSTDEAADASSGAYLVIAGTFSDRSNAETMVKKLKKMGYDKAVVRPLGKYAVARVDRFDSRSDAEALERELESKGIEDAYVRKKQ